MLTKAPLVLNESHIDSVAMDLFEMHTPVNSYGRAEVTEGRKKD